MLWNNKFIRQGSPILFHLNLGFLVSHELDAVQLQEWRILPLLNFCNDETGFILFTALHVPIMAAFFHYSHSLPFRRAINIFSIVHLGLHFAALYCPLNQFTGALSWCLIGGAAICGAADLWFNKHSYFQQPRIEWKKKKWITQWFSWLNKFIRLSPHLMHPAEMRESMSAGWMIGQKSMYFFCSAHPLWSQDLMMEIGHQKRPIPSTSMTTETSHLWR